MRYFILAIIAFMSSGCSSINNHDNKLLDTVDSIIDFYPDSALKILDTIDVTELNSKEGKAKYCLLSTIALLKTGHNIDTDTTLRVAIDFYENRAVPAREVMLTHYAMAATSDSILYKISEYQKAIRFAYGPNEDIYKALSYFNMANAYNQAYNSVDELECIKKGIDIISNTNDTSSIIYGHLIYGMAHNENGNHKEALNELNVAYRYSNKSIDHSYSDFIKKELAYTSSMLNDHQLAVDTYDSLLNSNKIDFTLHDTYAYIRSLSAQGDFTRAQSLLDSLNEQDIKESKGNWFYTNAFVKSRQGRYKEAYILLDSMLHFTYKFIGEKLDAKLSRQQMEIASSHALRQENIAEKRKDQLIYISIFCVIAIAVMFSAFYIVNLKHKYKIREHKLQNQKLIIDTQAQTDLLMFKIKQLDSSNKQLIESQKALETNILDLKLQKDSLNLLVSKLGKDIECLENDLKKEFDNESLLKVEISEHQEIISRLKDQLETSDLAITRFKKQSWENFQVLHSSIAAFCNEVPDGMHSPTVISVYESERDMRLKPYMDIEVIRKLEVQIDDLMDNVLSMLKSSISLGENDLRTIIYDICGFNYKTIGLLLNVTASAAASRRSRIKDRILSLDGRKLELCKKFLNMMK